MNASRRSVLILELAHLWGQVMHMPPAQAATSVEKEKFEDWAGLYPAEAAAAKKIQAQAFDAALNL